MNVLYFLRNFPKLSESFILNEIYELERSGHTVAVCARHNPDPTVTHDELEQLDIPIHYLDRPGYADVTELFSPKAIHPRIIRNTAYRAGPKNHAANLFWAKQCIEFVDGLPFDVDHVHTHFATLDKFPAKYVAAYYEIPFTITAHAFDIFQQPIGRYTPRLLKSADRVVTISEYNEAYLRERFVPNTPIDIIRAGIRPEKFTPTDNAIDGRIFTVSRFAEKKGLEYAIKAVAEITKTHPAIEYHLVGSGDCEQDLRELVSELGLQDTVQFLGHVSDDRLIREFDEARCFLLPCVIAEDGDRDGIPVALMEAMAMKTPPVSTPVSGIPELIDDGENGLLVSPRDPSETAAAIRQLLEADDTWDRLRERSRETVEDRFNIEREAEKLERTFELANVDR